MHERQEETGSSGPGTGSQRAMWKRLGMRNRPHVLSSFWVRRCSPAGRRKSLAVTHLEGSEHSLSQTSPLPITFWKWAAVTTCDLLTTEHVSSTISSNKAALDGGGRSYPKAITNKALSLLHHN
uniref:Uncharacterized protein n=1 Tax=Molossus molossus TaxID=27622 RepID=A0A7J8DUE2_MOLMO|nr:hypothetical protein HJG59_009190 [Molossus molossus]